MPIIDETRLGDFRDRELSPEAMLASIERYVQVLFKVSLGAGKSFAVDRLLQSPSLWKRFNLVVYAAPTWAILNERPIVNGSAEPPVPHLVIRPRPEEDCGPLKKAWEDLQSRGCSTYGKATLCKDCPQQECFWPSQLRDIKGTGLILTTEQQLLNVRSLLLLLQQRTQNRRALVILDEARFLNADLEIPLFRHHVEQLGDVLASMDRPPMMPEDVLLSWQDTVRHLLQAKSNTAIEGPLRLPTSFHYHSLHVQKAGIEQYGDQFRYSGYDLSLLGYSRPTERRLGSDGTIRFIARPFLRSHLIILSANMSGEYAGHRLGRIPVPSPFRKFIFRHSQTRILNLRNRAGADKNFMRNHKQILDTVAVTILKNYMEGRSTILISREKRKSLCVKYLEGRLAKWGLKIHFVTHDYSDLPDQPEPGIVPFIHYGMLGQNDFTGYEVAICCTGYYISDRTLKTSLREAEPGAFKAGATIETGSDRIRRAVVIKRSSQGLSDDSLANIYFRMLEVDPVLQAAGRVRFPVKPRLVVFFQMADLSPEVGAVEDVETLRELRTALEIPPAKAIDTAIVGRRIQKLRERGLTRDKIMKRLGLSRATYFRRLADPSLKKPNRFFIRVFETVEGSL